MNSIWDSLKTGYSYLKNGQLNALWESLRVRLYSRSVNVGLRRDIRIPFEAPDASIDIFIRSLESRDIDRLLDGEQLMQINPRIIRQRRAMVNADFRICYVAVTDDEAPCYMQWLIGSEYNRDIALFFGGIFPYLNTDESLMEGAFAHPDFRGKKIMPAAMARIAAKANEMNGVRWVLTFVGLDNIASLKGCHRAGFSPYMLRIDRSVLFVRFTSFGEIDEEVKAKYESLISAPKAVAA